MERNTNSSGEFEASPAPVEKSMAIRGTVRGSLYGAVLALVLFGTPVWLLAVAHGQFLIAGATVLGAVLGALFGTAISLRISRYTDKNRKDTPNRPNIPLRN